MHCVNKVLCLLQFADVGGAIARDRKREREREREGQKQGLHAVKPRRNFQTDVLKSSCCENATSMLKALRSRTGDISKSKVAN